VAQDREKWQGIVIKVMNTRLHTIQVICRAAGLQRRVESDRITLLVCNYGRFTERLT